METSERIETVKYQRIWTVEEYGHVSPAMRIMPNIEHLFNQYNIKTILDAGCGSGKSLKYFLGKGYDATGVDIALNGLIDKALIGNCIKAPLWKIPLTDKKDCIFCVDVMEHIPSEYIDLVLAELARICGNIAIFHVALFEHKIGDKVLDKLHMSVLPPSTWESTISKHFNIVDVRRDIDLNPNSHVTFICNNT